jgi:hypothetical protein
MKISALTGLFLLAALPAQTAPIVVELFQSQGCSSCPPAIANVNALAGRPDILALSFGVTYWDYLGWRDTFAHSEFTSRQYDYKRGLHTGSVYTPQVVIDGRVDLTGTNRGELDAAIGRAVLPKDAPSLALASNAVTVSTAAAPAGGADVWLVRYDPRIQNVDIAAGENSGVLLAHKNIVRGLSRLGIWSGAAQAYAIPAGGDPAWRSAILVQAKNGGPILAAAKL